MLLNAREEMNMRNENIKERLEAYMKESGLSQAKIAPLIGVSMTALSQYRNGIYKGDVKAVESKIEEYMETVEEQMCIRDRFRIYCIYRIFTLSIMLSMFIFHWFFLFLF